jgi:hypothetical protein
MKLLSIFAIATSLGWVSAYATQTECEAAGGTWDHGGGRPRCIDDTAEKCHARGGSWSREGRLQYLTCVMPTKDGGKVCSDSSECEQECLYTHGDPAAPGGQVKGRCAPTNNPFGCSTPVVKGEIGSTRCVD